MKSRNQYNEPCRIDRMLFKNMYEAYEYLMQINGRANIEILARFLRQGRRFYEGHRISLAIREPHE